MRYLSGCTAASYQQAIINLGVGLVGQPHNPFLRHLERFPAWAEDNGCASVIGGQVVLNPDWSLGWWVKMLGGIVDLPLATKERCLFVLVPDVPCDHAGTLERFRLYRPWVALTGLPIAFALQNGATAGNVPWDEFDVAFLAGDTEWKLGRAAFDLACRARELGKWIHMGRVNSWERLDYASTIGCDSSDGTFMKHGKPADMVAQIKVWLANNSPRLTQKLAVP